MYPTIEPIDYSAFPHPLQCAHVSPGFAESAGDVSVTSPRHSVSQPSRALALNPRTFWRNIYIGIFPIIRQRSCGSPKRRTVLKFEMTAIGVSSLKEILSGMRRDAYVSFHWYSKSNCLSARAISVVELRTSAGQSTRDPLFG